MSKPRIFIADPDVDILYSLEVYFQFGGYEVKTVESLDDLIKIVRSWQPTAILMSDEFPEQSPYQISQTLLEDTLTGHIPIIMLLHLNNRQSRLAALEAGANDIVAKPFDIEELKLRVEAAIRLSTLRAEA
jgi:putative two-component system response regulator